MKQVHKFTLTVDLGHPVAEAEALRAVSKLISVGEIIVINDPKTNKLGFGSIKSLTKIRKPAKAKAYAK